MIPWHLNLVFTLVVHVQWFMLPLHMNPVSMLPLHLQTLLEHLPTVTSVAINTCVVPQGPPLLALNINYCSYTYSINSFMHLSLPLTDLVCT